MEQVSSAASNLQGARPCTSPEVEWHPTVSTPTGAMRPDPQVSPRKMKTNPLDRLAQTVEDLSATRNALLECSERLQDAPLAERANHLSVVVDDLAETLREALKQSLPRGETQEARSREDNFEIPAPSRCVPVRLGAEHFVFNDNHVSQALVLSEEQAQEEISFACGAPVIRVDESLLPLIYLSDVLGAPRNEHAGSMTILPVHVRDQTYGLVVDEVGDAVDVSCLPPPRVLRSVKTYAGACQLQSGDVALLLDPEGVAIAGGMAVGPNAPSQLPPPMQVPAE